MSWISVAEGHAFPIQNLPFGVFSSHSTNHLERRIGVAIGDYVLDLKAIHYAGLLDDLGFDARVFTTDSLNSYMALDKSCWRATRACITSLLSSTSEDNRLRDNPILQQESIFPSSEIDMHLPAKIGDYTDFYSSKEHATNVGIMFRGIENALQPNWLHLPVGYHGRASSVVVSGTDVTRPHGQLQASSSDPKAGSTFGPTKQLDFELEMAFFVGGIANPLGKPITMAEAEDRIFGVVLMNDWSARDVQAWEYVPLGPFTAKNFCTSISPWVVSMDALTPFQCAPSAGPVQVPEPLPYLLDPQYDLSAYDVKLEVKIEPSSSGVPGTPPSPSSTSSTPTTVSRSNMKNLYWNSKQQLVHHSVSGCPMLPGDLLGTGTISGPTDSAMGSMLELSWKGSRSVILSGEGDEVRERKFLQDGDTVIIEGYADSCADNEGDVKGYRIGFGSVKGKILPALTSSLFVAPPPTSPSLPATLMSSSGSIGQGLSSTVLHSIPTMTYPDLPKAYFRPPPIKYTDFRLYSYWRSTCSWRVRVALALKGVTYEYVPVNILSRYTNDALEGVNVVPNDAVPNPLNQVPVLEFTSPKGEKIQLTQSLAVMELLEDLYPSELCPLLPTDVMLRARVKEIAELVTSGIQPLQSIGIIRQVKHFEAGELKGDGSDYAKLKCKEGMDALEKLLSALRAPVLHQQLGSPQAVYAAGTAYPTLADLCVVPQLYNAKVRLGITVDESTHPHVCAVEAACRELEAFRVAAPDMQPDAIKTDGLL